MSMALMVVDDFTGVIYPQTHYICTGGIFGSVFRASALGLKGHRFDSSQAYIPRLQAQSLA